ncbi:MAG: alcohol dehydrogenase catalytic domain-containing protein, partial [Nitrososphaerales archaeon]
MKAAVLERLGAPLSIRDVPVPSISEGEALVETSFCGICGTDLHILEGRGYVPRLPHILGHEPCGAVARVGGAAEGLRVGDRVVPYLFATCGSCWYCRSGRDSMCSKLGGIIGVTTDGAF